MILILEVKDLTVSYENMCKKQDKDEVFKLENISFCLEPGTITGIIGRNGSGKTTLLKTLCGELSYKKGSVSIGGMEISYDRKTALMDIGFISCEEMFCASYRIIDLADYHGQFYPEYSKEKFIEHCEKFGINYRHKYDKLSTGMKIKFAYAFAISHNAKVVIMDEPMEGLDPVSRREFTDLLFDITEDGSAAVLYSTHLTEELENVADNILVLEKGKQLLFEGINSIQDKYFKNEKISLKQLLFDLTGAKFDYEKAEDRYWEDDK